MRLVDTESTAMARPGVQKTHSSGQLPIGAAPVGDPFIEAEVSKVASREINANLLQEATFDRPQTVLRHSERNRHVTNPACAARLTASRAERMPANRVFAVGPVSFDPRKGRHQHAPHLAIQHPDLGGRQNRARVVGQLLLESDKRSWRPVTYHDIFTNIFMPTTVHIPDPLLKSVDRRAKALGISRNRLVVRALEQAISVREGWSPEFLQRLRHVDRETSTAVDELLTTVKQARRSKEPRNL